MRFRLCAIAVAAIAAPGAASAQTWETIAQPGGYKVARVVMNGGATGIGLTCERGTVVIAISLARVPRRNPALLTIKGGAGSASFGISRNGTTNIWAAVVKELRLLDMMARGGSVALAVDGSDYGTASLTGADGAMRTALAGCWRPALANAPAPPPASSSGDPDEEAIRGIVARLYGSRDGRPVTQTTPNEWEALFTSRIRALLAQCEAGIENADPKSNGGEGAYMVTGDQGCVGIPFLVDPVLGDPAPFMPRVRPVVRRIGPDAMTSEIVVPPAFRTDWGTREVIRFQRVGGRWLIDEVVTTGTSGQRTYSGSIAEMTGELRKIARRAVPSRKR